MRNKQQARYGIFYRSNGRFTTTPYGGMTFTLGQITRRPLREHIKTWQNYILKSKMVIRPVTA